MCFFVSPLRGLDLSLFLLFSYNCITPSGFILLASDFYDNLVLNKFTYLIAVFHPQAPHSSFVLSNVDIKMQ